MGWLRVIKGTIWCPIWPPRIKIAIWLFRVPILGQGVARSQLGAKVPKLHQNVGTCMGLVGQLLSQNWCSQTNMLGTPPLKPCFGVSKSSVSNVSKSSVSNVSNVSRTCLCTLSFQKRQKTLETLETCHPLQHFESNYFSCPNNHLLSALLIVESVHSIPVAGTYAGSLLWGNSSYPLDKF